MSPRSAKWLMTWFAGACISPLVYYWILTDWWFFPFLICCVLIVLIYFLITYR